MGKLKKRLMWYKTLVRYWLIRFYLHQLVHAVNYKGNWKLLIPSCPFCIETNKYGSCDRCEYGEAIEYCNPGGFESIGSSWGALFRDKRESVGRSWEAMLGSLLGAEREADVIYGKILRRLKHGRF